MNTTINISMETKKRLSALGKHGQSYNDIVVEILDAIEEKNFKAV
jgi:predicted DNA-binding protein